MAALCTLPMQLFQLPGTSRRALGPGLEFLERAVRVPAIQFGAGTRHGPREAVVNNDGLALWVGISVTRHYIVFRENANFGGFLFDDGLDTLVAIKGVESGYGQAVEDDGKDDEPVHDGDHGADQPLFFFSLGVFWLWE